MTLELNSIYNFIPPLAMIYPAKSRFIPPFKPPNANLSRHKLACLGEKCWYLQNYLDKSVVEIQKYLDKSVVEIHFYQDKSVKSAFFANFTKNTANVKLAARNLALSLAASRNTICRVSRFLVMARERDTTKSFPHALRNKPAGGRKRGRLPGPWCPRRCVRSCGIPRP